VQDPQEPGRDVRKPRRQHPRVRERDVLNPRRKHPRIWGPFGGKRVGALPVAIHIHDLSLGGCFVESSHEEPAGRRITIEIELPHEGWITLQTETLYTRPDYGFAVKFVDTPDETRAALERVINQLLAKSPTNG